MKITEFAVLTDCRMDSIIVVERPQQYGVDPPWLISFEFEEKVSSEKSFEFEEDASSKKSMEIEEDDSPKPTKRAEIIAKLIL